MQVSSTASLLPLEVLVAARPSSSTLAARVEAAADLATLYSSLEDGARAWLEGWQEGMEVWRISSKLSMLPALPTGPG